MKRFSITQIKSVLTTLSLFWAGLAYAQTNIIIGAGSNTATTSNSTAADAGPMYCTGGTSSFVFSKHHMVYTAAELATAGLPNNVIITQISWYKANNAAYSSASASIFDIYLKNSAATGVPTPVPQSFANITSGATPVYTTTSQTFSNNIGWVEFNLSTPFTYTGGALELTTNWDISAGGSSASGATANFAWAKDPGVDILAHSAATQSANFTSLRTARAQIRLTYIPAGPCTAPPTAGTATVSNTIVCAGENISLNLSGSSTGSGQTYQWQSGSSASGPWTNIGTAQTASNLTTPALSGNIFYQCVVTCGASSANSTAVSVNANAGLPAGTYTINSALPTGGSNFNSFADVTTALNCGIAGPVTMNVVAGSGPYNETVQFGNILGSSAINTIRINGNGAIVQFNNTTSARQLLTLDGTKYMRIDSLVFKSLNTTYGWGARITGGAAYDSITRCQFDMSSVTSTTAGNINGIIFSASTTSATSAGVNGTNVYIANNHIKGSGAAGGLNFGIGIASGGSDSNIIKNNLIENFYNNGIYIASAKFTLVESNEIHKANKTAGIVAGEGIYTASGDMSGSKIIGNRIHSPGGTVGATSTFRGLSLLGDGTATDPVIVANNVIYNINQGGASSGIYVSTGTYNLIYHNTVSFDQVLSGTSANYGIYTTGTNTGTDIVNNLVSITAGTGGIKYGFYYATANGINDAQKNNYYLNSTQSGVQNYGYYTTAYATQAAFQTAYPTLEVGSPTADPQFTAPATGNFLPTNIALMGTGMNLFAAVPDDINGAPRSFLPTPGAYEIAAIPGANGGVVSLIDPTGLFCPGTQNVRVSVANFGTLPLTGFQIHWQINGVNQAPITYSGTLVPFGGSGQSIDTVSLGNTGITAANTIIKAWTVISNDINTTNDTTEATVSPTVFELVAISDTICFGNELNMSLSPSTGYTPGMIQWQSSTNGTTFTSIPNSDQPLWTVNNFTANTWYRVNINGGSTTCTTNTKAVVVPSPAITGTTSASRCDTGSVQLSATANAGSVVNWYTSATGGAPIGTGNTFTTPGISATTTYYAGATAGGGVGSVGPVSPSSVGTSSGTSSAITTYHMAFDVQQPTTLLSVDVYPTAAIGSSAAIQIQDNASNIIATIPYTTTVTGGTTPQTISLNVTLPPGTGYKMGQQPAAALMRNSAGAVYPYTSSAINIVSNNFGAAYFYYFYNWQFSSGCESTRVPVEATVNPNPVVDLGADTLICSTGNYVLDAGNTGATYLWSDNSTAQTNAVTTSGQYHVTVTNSNNCSVSDTVSVNITTPPVVNLGNDTAICLGSSLTLDAGNNPGASILWDNFTVSQTRTVTTAGQYTVEVAYNQNCKSMDTINLSINPLPVVDLGNDTAICGTGALTLDAGNPGASYLWHDGSTMQTKTVGQAGQYHVVVTDANNCASSDTVEVIQIPLPSGNFTVAEGPNGQMTFTAATSNTVSYHWSFGDGNTATINPASHQYMANGNYPVTLTIVNECGAESEIIREVSIRNRAVGINDAFDDQQILIYPNPASDKLILENKGSGNLKSVVIIDALGRTVKTVETTGNTKKTIVDLNGLANGLYTVSLQTPDGKMVRKFKIVR